MRVAPRIVLSKQEQRTLEKWASTRSTSVRMRERARIVLMAAEGITNKAIAAQLGIDTNKVRNLSTTLRHWRLRFTEQSLLLWMWMWQVG